MLTLTFLTLLVAVKAESENTPLRNLRKWAMQWWEERYEYEKKCQRVHLHTRTGNNGALSIPLLEGQKMLSAGTRSIYFSWEGGTPPYRIRLYRQFERQPFIEKREIKENSLKLDNLNPLPGNYNFWIDDTEDRKLQKEFAVVDSDQIPYVPDKLQQSDLTKEEIITIYATWLAAQNHGKWVFESYQLVCEIAENYHPACLVRNALAEGERPANPPEIGK
jgi:hypothetical protein